LVAPEDILRSRRVPGLRITRIDGYADELDADEVAAEGADEVAPRLEPRSPPIADIRNRI
jgi:hypothetical protein